MTYVGRRIAGTCSLPMSVKIGPGLCVTTSSQGWALATAAAHAVRRNFVCPYLQSVPYFCVFDRVGERERERERERVDRRKRHRERER